MDEVLVFHLQSGAVRSFLSLIDQPPWTYIHDTYPQYCCLIYTVKLNAALSTECLVHKSIWVRAMYQHYCQGSVHCVSIVTQLLWVQTSAVKHWQKLPVGGWPVVLIVPSQSVYCTAAHWQGSNGGWPAEEVPTDRWHGERSTGNHIGETHVSCVWTIIRLNGVWKRFTKRGRSRQKSNLPSCSDRWPRIQANKAPLANVTDLPANTSEENTRQGDDIGMWWPIMREG